MRTVLLKKDAVHRGNLILVNRQYPYRENAPKTLIPIDAGNANVLLECQIGTIYEKLMDELCGWEQITAVSGWRGAEEQKQIYNHSLIDNGSAFTEKYVALAGHSEHQTGMAVDLALKSPDIDLLRPHFPYTGICGAFREKALQYGFIERYPKDKEELTGIAHEPWHFRYVGAPHSIIMQQKGLCFEEYLCLLRNYPYGMKPLTFYFDECNIEISYLAAEECETLFEMEDDVPCSISGDNRDGFVVTVWRNRR